MDVSIVIELFPHSKVAVGDFF